MKLYRIAAIMERDLRKFFRSPALMMISMVFPMMQLIVLGYAFGGKIKGVKIALVDQDRAGESRLVRQRLNAIAEGPKTFSVSEYSNLPDAMTDIRAGFVKAVLYIPPDFSQRVLRNDRPRIAFIEDNTDGFTTSGIFERIQQIQADLNGPIMPPLVAGESPASNLAGLFSPQRLPGQIEIQTVEVYPYIEYIKYLLAGSISLSIFVVAMLGGGITFIDDKARGLHEGYLVTPVHKGELVLGLCFAGAVKGIMSGTSLTIIGGLIAGIGRLWDPVRLLYLILVIGVTSLCMISLMFLMMVRVSDPMVPRALFGVLNTLLFFPSGAIYPAEGFPWWLRAINRVDPFTYAVHALKNLLLKNTGFEGIYFDVAVLLGFAVLLLGEHRVVPAADLRLDETTGGREGVTLLDSSEEPHSKRLRYAVTAVAFVLLMAFGIWFFFLRFISEKRTVAHFMDAVVAQNFQLAYQIWKPHGTYPYPDFLADWNRTGYYGPLLSYRIESAGPPRNGGSGVIVTVEISPFQPFPANEDPQSARNREVKLWVERSDGSLSFPP